MRKWLGLVIMVLVAAGIGLAQYLGKSDLLKKVEPLPEATVTVLVGGEKMDFLKDEEVQKLLKNKWSLTLDTRKAGSLEMVAMATAGIDGLWPSSQVASDIYRRNNGVLLAEETIFNSPVVAYASAEVAEALIRAKIAEKRDGTVYLVDCPKLFSMNEQGLPWSTLGLPHLTGRVKVHSSDPTTSNSGVMFLGLLANILNGGDVVTEQELPKVKNRVVGYFKKLGTMERSTSDLFKTFLSNLMYKPIIIGYENQIVEYSLQNPSYADLLKAQIRTMYPVPTVWSSHPFLATTANGKRLLEALKDPEIQRIAWEKHGFRSGLLGVQNDPKVLMIGGIPKTVDAIVQVPASPVMQLLIAGMAEPATTTGN